MVLLIVSLATTLTNVVIIYKLRLIPGFQYFDVTKDRVIFHKDAYIDKILLAKNKISGLSTVTGNIELRSGNSSLRLDHNGIEVSATYGFEVRCPHTGEQLFPFDFSSVPLTTVRTLSVPSGISEVKLIRSPVNEDLNIFAKERIRIRGNKGVTIEGKHINVQAASIFLASINSSITMDAPGGVYLNMHLLRNKMIGSEGGSGGQTGADGGQSISKPTSRLPQFLLCVCAKNGRLFRMAVKDHTSSCADARFPQSENPCV